jgi:hypothetical protein
LVGGLGRWHRRRRAFGLWATAAATVLVVGIKGVAARADERAPRRPLMVMVTATPATTAAASPPLLAQPTIYETGRVGVVDLPALPDPSARIQPVADGTRAEAMPDEPPVLSPVPGAGIISAALLEHELDLKFLALDGCRIEAARRRRSPIAAIAAGRLTLRWTVLPGGDAAATEAVAQEPVDPLVLACVKRKMSRWMFPHPLGGSVRLVRAFSFRASPFI